MTEEGLALIAGVIFSLLASYVPKFDEWYAAKDATFKRVFMLGLLAIAAIGIFGVGCLGWFNEYVATTCDTAGAVGLIKILVLAVIANQSTYLVSPETKKVGAAKATRI